jgi:hypothetical protein
VLLWFVAGLAVATQAQHVVPFAARVPSLQRGWDARTYDNDVSKSAPARRQPVVDGRIAEKVR